MLLIWYNVQKPETFDVKVRCFVWTCPQKGSLYAFPKYDYKFDKLKKLIDWLSKLFYDLSTIFSFRILIKKVDLKIYIYIIYYRKLLEVHEGKIIVKKAVSMRPMQWTFAKPCKCHFSKGVCATRATPGNIPA